MRILVCENFTSKYGQQKIHRFEMDTSDTVSKLFDYLAKEIKIPSRNLIFYKDDFILNNEYNAEFYNFHENTILTIALNGMNELDDNNTKIYIEYYLSGIKFTKLFVNLKDTIKLLKEQLMNEFPLINIDCSKSLFSGNIIMKDNKTLDQYGVRDYSRITLKQNILLKNISGQDGREWNFDGVVRINCQSMESVENLRQISEAISIDTNFINVNKYRISDMICAGEYLCFICNENYREDSIIVFVKESFTESGIIKTHPVVLRGSYLVDDASKKIQDILDFNIEFKLKCGENILNENLDLTKNKITDFSELVLLYRILIKNLADLTTFTMWISLDLSVLQLKESIANKLSGNVGKVTLSFSGKQLDDNELLSKYEIDEGSMILLVVTLIGGDGSY